MSSSSRIFHCHACHKQIIICSSCDRGNIYCGKSCSKRMRKANQRIASANYQATRRGKFKHAVRQINYRKRLLAKKVTHQGSQPKPNTPSFKTTDNVSTHKCLSKSKYHCFFCNQEVSDFLFIENNNNRRTYSHTRGQSP